MRHYHIFFYFSKDNMALFDESELMRNDLINLFDFTKVNAALFDERELMKNGLINLFEFSKVKLESYLNKAN